MTTPTISNVTGTVSTGQTLTVTGTNMLDRSVTNWDAALQSNQGGFEGASITADGFTGAMPYATDRKLLGSQSAKWSATGSGQHQTVNYNDNFSNSVSDIYCALYQNLDFTTNGNGTFANLYHKIFLFYSASPTQNYPINFNWNASASAYTQVQLLLDSTGVANGTIADGSLQENKWYHLELKIPNGSPHNYQCWVNGTQVIDYNHSSSPNASNFNFQFPVNLESDDAGFGYDIWHDDLVLSTSRVYPACTVEVSDNATYGSGTLVYQYPISIANTSVQVECNLTGLGAGPYYMFVTNGQNQRVATAYDLSGGGGGGNYKSTGFSYWR